MGSNDHIRGRCFAHLLGSHHCANFGTSRRVHADPSAPTSADWINADSDVAAVRER